MFLNLFAASLYEYLVVNLLPSKTLTHPSKLSVGFRKPSHIVKIVLVTAHDVKTCVP
jgi:hypothetical protein